MADGSKKQDPRTVFVRGVDAAVTDAQLQEFFSEIGPVRNAFLVRRGGKEGPHKGFGFVQFAVAEDAARAAAELHGTELAGRKLKVEGAVKRAPLEDRKKRKQEAAAAPADQPQAAAEAAEQQPAAKKPRPAKPASKPSPAAAAAAEAKHKWLRTVAVGGLTPEAVGAAIQMARAAGEVELVIQPVPDKLAAQFMLLRDGCTGESFLAVYKSVKEAMAAVAKLHGQTASAAQQQGGGKKGEKAAVAAAEAAGGGCRVWARQLSGDGLHQKRWRLVVRNLPFTATEADLRAVLDPAGFVWELSLPRSAGGRGRGFAFVGFTCKAHAERAIKLANGQPVAGRPVAVDWAVAKAQYGATAQQEAAVAKAAAGAEGGGAAEQEGPGSDVESESEGSGDEGAHGARLGHEEDGEAAAAAVEPEQERRMLSSVIDGILGGSDEEEGSEEEEEEEESEGEEGSEEEEEGSGEESGSEEEEADREAEGEEAAADPGSPADPFSRKQLQQKAAAAAAAQGADPLQQRQRAEPEAGATVFIRGLPLDVSKEQVFLKMKTFGPVRSCRLVVDKASGKLKGTAFVDFYKLASAQAAAEACAKGRRKDGPGVVIAGRVADVDLALGQDDVRALAVQKASERGPRDSRRLALAKEGQIAEGSPAWEDMSAGDRAKRKRAAEEKKLKLRSPNFVVSDTRLSVRNIPLSWTEKQLKAAAIAAVKERAKKAQPVVKQAKILLDEERPGPDGAPRSKGIGFVEFTEHEHALCALRQLNNNPATFTKDRRPVVEFALENVKALKLREAKLAKAKQPRQQEGGAAAGPQHQQQQAGGGNTAAPQQQQQQGEGGEEQPAEQKSKRQLRKERRLMLKERRKAQQGAAAAEQGGGGGEGAAAAANGTPGGEVSKAAKRRELRKKRKAEQQGLAAPAAAKPAAKPAPAAAKPAQAAAKPAAKAAPSKGVAAAAAGPKPGRAANSQPRQAAAAAGKPQQAAGGKPQQAARPGVNSRAAKAAAATQQEQQAQRRKRSSDDLIDKLAEGPAGALREKKKRKKEETDSVDQLAKQYLSKYFTAGTPKSSGGKAAAAKVTAGRATAGAAMKRWFE